MFDLSIVFQKNTRAFLSVVTSTIQEPVRRSRRFWLSVWQGCFDLSLGHDLKRRDHMMIHRWTCFLKPRFLLQKEPVSSMYCCARVCDVVTSAHHVLDVQLRSMFCWAWLYFTHFAVLPQFQQLVWGKDQYLVLLATVFATKVVDRILSNPAGIVIY